MRIGQLATALCVLALLVSTTILATQEVRASRPFTGTLTIGFLNKVDSLNPFRGISNEAYLFYTLVYDPLYAMDQDQNPVADIATSATPNVDGSAWTYEIRQGVKWSDGSDLTAADVAFTFNYNIRNFFQLWAYQPYVNTIKQCSGADTQCGAQVTGPSQVTLYFTGPFAPGYAFDAPYILKESQWTGIPLSDAQYRYDNPNPIGTGPFIADPGIYAAWLNDAPLVLHRNPNYWAGAPSMENLVLRHFSDENAEVSALVAGEIDIAVLTAAGYDAVTALNNPLIAQQEGLDVIQQWVDVGITQANSSSARNSLNPARFDLNVRQAMAIATDKNFILNQFYRGKGQVGTSLVSPIQPFWHYEPDAGVLFPYSLQQANALLNASGYSDWTGGSFGNGLRMADHDIYLPEATVTVPQGTPLSFTMVNRVESPQEYAIATYLKQNWALAGIGLTLTQEQESAMETDVYGAKFDTYVWWWSSDPDPNYILSIQAGSTVYGWNDNFFDNASYNFAYEQQLSSLNLTTRQYWAHEAQRIDYVAAPFLIVVYPFYEVAYWTDLWTGWGDMNAHPGRQVMAFYGMHPLFLSLKPTGAPQVALQGTAGRPGQAVTIAAQITDTRAGTWYLQFGDGSAKAGSYASGTTNLSEAHTYTLPANATQMNFTVTLSADNLAYNVTSSNTVTIQSVGVIAPTILSFTANRTSIKPGEQVSFTASVRASENGTLNLTVDFGDGTPVGTQRPIGTAGMVTNATFTHTYTREGSWPATLTAEALGVSSTPSSPVVVNVATPQTGPTGGAGLPDWALWAIIAVVAVVAATAVYFVYRRRSRETKEQEAIQLPPSKPPPPPPPPP